MDKNTEREAFERAWTSGAIYKMACEGVLFEDYVKNMAWAAWRLARASLPAEQAAGVSDEQQPEKQGCACWPGRMCDKSEKCAEEVVQQTNDHELPPLPAPNAEAWGNSSDPRFDAYDAQQMREYALSALSAAQKPVADGELRELLKEAADDCGIRCMLGEDLCERIDRAISAPAAQQPVAELVREAAKAGFIAAAKHPWHLKTTRDIAESAEKYAELHVSRTLSASAAPQQSDFDAWQASPYTKAMQKSIAEDYVPKAQQPSETAIPELRNMISAHTLGDFVVQVDFRSCRSAEAFKMAVNKALLRPAAQEAEKPQSVRNPFEAGSNFMVSMDSLLRQAEAFEGGKISTESVRNFILCFQPQEAAREQPAPKYADLGNGDAAMWVEDGKVKAEWNPPAGEQPADERKDAEAISKERYERGMKAAWQGGKEAAFRELLRLFPKRRGYIANLLAHKWQITAIELKDQFSIDKADSEPSRYEADRAIAEKGERHDG